MQMQMQTLALREELVTRAKSLKLLPTLSTVIDKVFKLLNDGDSSFNELTEVLKNDQAISSKIISISNSAYYSRGVKVVSMQRAMIAIGFDEIKNIVTCLAFLDGILKNLKLREEDLKALWRHSLSVACAAKTISLATLVEDPEKVFTAALLHDVGKVILYAHCPDYRQTLEQARARGVDPCGDERGRFGTDHQEIGYYMAVKWRFPEEFCKVIRYHHRPRNFADREVLLGIVGTADCFVEFPDSDLGVEGIILMREKQRIDAEIERISELVGV
jgi:putative nucleotidyltransferase with HDIG domain